MRKEEGEMAASLSLSRRPDSPAATPPLEDEDLLEEILLRLAPMPSSLPRASLVSDRWRRLVSDPKFFRRFSLRHRRNPPLLGFFDMGNDELRFVPTLEAPDHVSPGRFSLQFEDNRFWIANSRHGLVLVFPEHWKQVLVWDPVTADQHLIALPPAFVARPGFHGAVLHAAGDAQHFQLVLIDVNQDDPQHRQVVACVYLSETGVWGETISAPLPPRAPTSRCALFVDPSKPAVLVENSLYWMLGVDLVGILEFDLERRSIAVIQSPVDVFTEGKYEFAIVRAVSGGLGFLFVSKPDCSAQLWKRKTDSDGVPIWVLEKTIELNKLIPMNSEHLHLIGFAEYNNVVFLSTAIGVIMIHLESLQFKKLPHPNMGIHYHPFESVYAAGI